MADPVTAFRAAQDKFNDDLVTLMAQHEAALGGPAGVVIALVAMTGELCVRLTKAAPMSEPLVFEQLSKLALFVSASRSTPQ